MKNSFGYCQLANNFHQENRLNIKKNPGIWRNEQTEQEKAQHY